MKTRAGEVTAGRVFIPDMTQCLQSQLFPGVCNAFALNIDFEPFTFTFLAITTFKRHC